MACVDLVDGLEISCNAENKVGGINKRVYIGQLSQLDTVPFTTDADGNIDEINFATASPAYGLHKFTSRKDKQSGTYELAPGENINIYETAVNLELFHYTQEDKDVIMQLVNADDVFVVVQNNAGQMEVFGIEEGLNASAGSGGTGVLLNDKTSFSLTLSGGQKKLPYVFLNGGTLATSISYLDGISV